VNGFPFRFAITTTRQIYNDRIGLKQRCIFQFETPFDLDTSIDWWMMVSEMTVSLERFDFGSCRCSGIGLCSDSARSSIITQTTHPCSSSYLFALEQRYSFVTFTSSCSIASLSNYRSTSLQSKPVYRPCPQSIGTSFVLQTTRNSLISHREDPPSSRLKDLSQVVRLLPVKLDSRS
jgi:hypothetical protein